LGHPYAVGDRLAKVIPLGAQGFPMTIDRALYESPEFKVIYDTDPVSKQIVDLAREIEGNSRHISVHAAGIVISPDLMTNYTPLQYEPNGTKVITQYEMHSLLDEYGGVGLVKVDVLGIRNLSILGAARDLIEKSRGIKIDLGKIPIDDKKTFAMLARGETMGTFQLGGSGMTKWLKELKPNRVEDLMNMVAIFRPGPMANIPEYIDRKNGKKKVEYYHPKMEKYLDKSYGILVYQDDVLFTALEIAGYTWESVDKFRKAIGKKIPEEMAKQHEIFVEGCQKTSGMTKDEAEKLWDLFVPFQGYGFNKAHAASYGIVSYQTAYLKANYPVEYMTALLTAESGNTEKIVEAIDECKRMKIKVLAPDVNKSDTQFTIEDGTSIRFGLSAIKNVGDVAITLILEARTAGPFTSLTDLCLRVDAGKVNRKVLESLIKTGALDTFGKRSAMLAGLDKIRESGMSVNKAKNLGQFSLFGEEEGPKDTTDNLPDIDEIEKKQKLNLEKELLGFYLTEHPHAQSLGEAYASGLPTHKISDLYQGEHSGQTVTVVGVVESCRNVVTKAKGEAMCFAKITDLSKAVEVVVFPKTYATTNLCWQIDNLVIVTGRLENRTIIETEGDEEEVEQTYTLIADTAAQFTGPDTVLPKAQNSKYSKPATQPSSHIAISITIPRGTPQSKLVTLNSLLQASKGDRPAELIFEGVVPAKILPLPFGLTWSEDLKTKIDILFS
ncbi:MAG: DNA polymerase III subunit alpha, partial [Patescibacteria group bacterium]